MEYRPLGTTDMSISSVSFGTWALGGDWGDVTEENAKSALNHAIDRGVNFLILQMFTVVDGVRKLLVRS